MPLPPPYAAPSVPQRHTRHRIKDGHVGLQSFMSDFQAERSAPPTIVYLAHVGFNSSTGELTGFPKERQQLLQEGGISKSEQEKNPQAVLDIGPLRRKSKGPRRCWPAEFSSCASFSQGIHAISHIVPSPSARPPRPQLLPSWTSPYCGTDRSTSQHGPHEQAQRLGRANTTAPK
jgi:p21-activated kinase 1